MKTPGKLICALLACLALTAASAAAMTAYAADGDIVLPEIPITTLQTGDVDGDGTPATPKDAMYLARYLAGWDGYDRLINFTASDIDQDKSVTVRDAVILARYISGGEGYEDYFPEKNITDKGQCGDKLYWRLYEDGTLEIYGEGDMWDFTFSSPAPWIKYKDSINTIKLTDKLTSIGSRAFYNCVEITDNLLIPGSVTSIGEKAFCACYYITGNITIPESVTFIGNEAFGNCVGLSSVYFQSDVPSSFGSDVFANTHASFRIYYNPGTANWSTPTWNGYKCLPINSPELNLSAGTVYQRMTAMKSEYPEGRSWTNSNIYVLNIFRLIRNIRAEAAPDSRSF